jgi:hypothetical protein
MSFRLALVGRGRAMVLGLASLILLIAFEGGSGQGFPPSAPDQRQALRLLSSRGWQSRYRGVQMLEPVPATELVPAARKKVIDLLGSETKDLWEQLEGKAPVPKHPGLTEEQYQEGTGEAVAEYYAALLGLVLKLHDPSALPVLVAADPQPSEVDLEIARYGRKALGPVLANLDRLSRIKFLMDHTPEPPFENQMAMADTLTQTIKFDEQSKLHPPLTPSDYTRIRAALRRLLESRNDYVRLYASLGLARAHDEREAPVIQQVFAGFLSSSLPGKRSDGLDKIASGVDDPRFVPMAKVRELAASDPHHYKQGTLGTGPVVYPVRDAARKVLNKFSKRSAPSAVK